MKLLPDKVAKTLPPLYSTEQTDDPIAWVKFFTPDSSWKWYLVEYDPVKRIAYGLAVGDTRELGYFSIEEIESVRGLLGLPVERDLYWEPVPLSRCP